MKLEPIVISLLDSDLYKFNMDQVIFHKHTDLCGQYYFKCRNKDVVFTEEMVQEINEQVDRHAFDGADVSDVIAPYNHQGHVFARTGTGTLMLTADDHGLHVRMNLAGTELGRQLYEEIKGGYTTKMSFGFTVKTDERLVTEEHGKTVVLRTIKEIGKLYDVSAVSLPANDATSISARSYGEGVIAELAEEHRKAQERARQIQRIKILTEVI